MPPRVQKRAVRRATTRATRPQRARAKPTRGGNRRVSKNEDKIVEEKPEEVEEKPKQESWLDKLPPVIKPDEELHQKLTKERREKHLAKVHQYCSLEAKGILEFVLRSIDLSFYVKDVSDEIFGRKLRNLHADFREGLLTPEPENTDESIEPATCSINLEPKFSLEVQNYLRFTSDSMWKDLSTFFNCQLDEKIVHDPDPKMNEFLEYLQDHMKLFQQPYHPFDKIKFPFTICIIGPVGTGRTTVCQLLQKIFDVNIIDVVPQPPTDNVMRRRKSIQQIEQIQDIEPQPEYPLQDSYTIKMVDDKSTISSIAQYIIENQSRGNIIVGYPNTKSQLIMLEKAIAQQQHNQLLSISKSGLTDSTSTSPRTPQSPTQQSSSKSKAPVYNIHGLIFTLNPNSSRERLIDPETGNVYQEDFLMPCFLDFYDVLPTEFVKKRDEIINRLTTITVPEIPNLTSKAISTMNSFESGCRKNYVTAVIPHCDTIDMMITQLDLFIDSLYKKNEKIIIEKPLEHLMRPFELSKPGLCYNAILSWRECLDLFAPTIADQSNLVDIIGNRLDQMTDAAFDRFALFTFTADKRASLCNEFQTKESNFQLPQKQLNSNSLHIQHNSNFNSSSAQSALSLPRYSSRNSSPSQFAHPPLSLPQHPSIPSNLHSSRLSFHNPLTSNVITPKTQSAMTARTPLISTQNAPNKIKTNIKPNIISQGPIQKQPVVGTEILTKRPKTSNSPPIKNMNIIKRENQNIDMKKRPQTHQAYIKSPFKNRAKSRFGNTDSDSNAEELEREMIEKEENRNREFSNFFKVIWDLSLKSRDQNLKHVTKVVEKSGLLELVVELRKTPKLIFIALILRLYYTRWFYDNFYELFTTNSDENEEEAVQRCTLLDEFKIDPIHPPRFDVQSRSTKHGDSMTQQSFSLKSVSGYLNQDNKQNQSIYRGKSMDDLSNVDVDEENLQQKGDYNDSQNQNQQQKDEYNDSQNIIDNFLKNQQKNNSKEEIFFNQEQTTNDFYIPPFKSTITFDDTLKFVDKFFNHYMKNLDDENLSSNVKSSLHLFKTFSKSVKNKEVVLTEAIKNLNHIISEYAYTKCSHEMENFSEKFRKMRKVGFIEGNLFEYDFSGIRKENRHLADFSINYEMPIIVQSIVSFKTVKKIADVLSNRNQKFCNLRSFLFTMRNIQGISEKEATAIELCVRVFVCSECFSIKKLLLCFVHFPEEEEIISKMFPDN